MKKLLKKVERMLDNMDERMRKKPVKGTGEERFHGYVRQKLNILKKEETK